MSLINFHIRNFHESWSFMKKVKIKILTNISEFIIHDVYYNIGVLRIGQSPRLILITYLAMCCFSYVSFVFLQPYHSSMLGPVSMDTSKLLPPGEVCHNLLT